VASRTKMTKYFGIYEIKNLINGKSYIGQSARSVHGRCNGHITRLRKNKDNQHLVNAVNKYGIENFSFRVILYCEEFELTRYEDGMINCDRPNRYNIREAADSNKGIKFSDEARHNISEGHKAENLSDEARHNLSLARMGNTALKGYVFTEESLRKLSECHKVAHLSAETRRKNSESLKGNQRAKGHHHTEETRRKMSLSHTGKSSGMKGYVVSEETKKKLSATGLEVWKKRRAIECAEKAKQ